jgi:ribosomal protein L11 methyltransferase
MNYYLFRILEGASIDEVQEELEQKGLKDFFVIEDDSVGEIFVGGHAKNPIVSKKLVLVEEKSAKVNWEEQWALFAENFSDGKAHIQLGNKTLLLTPGAGFGDLSHPTTYLMLEMMKSLVPNERVVDMGTGSGILALAALLLGAKSAIGIDIDNAALKHAKQNAKLNGLKAKFTKSLPKNLSDGNIFLMNMIFPEQKELQPNQLNAHAKIWIVSGILESQKADYLEQAAQWKWELAAEHIRLDWCGFIFVPNRTG